MNRNLYSIMLLGALVLISGAHSALESVDDNDLVHLLTGEENVIAIFTKSNCNECDELETVVENIHDDLKENLGAVVVKAHNSHMVSIYDPSKEPSLIYFRRGIPLLYYGEVNEDEIVQTFTENRDPVVKELSDDNFEHLTQASTGATTGDWFVFFYSADCVLCQRLYAVWEAVGAKLKHRLNVARVNRAEAGISTAKRFQIKESPDFIYLRQGKFFRYKVKDYSPKAFIDFAQNIHLSKNKPEIVPSTTPPMNDLLVSTMRIMLDNPQFLTFGSIAILLTILTALLCKCFTSKKSKVTENKKKSK